MTIHNLQLTINSFRSNVNCQLSTVLRKAQQGQALVTLLFFALIGITTTTAATMIILANSQSGMKFQEGSIVYEIAQSGIANAQLRLLRDPAYSGEVLPVGTGNATITVTPTGVNTYTIRSVGTLGNFRRSIQADISYTNDLLQVISQKEVD